MLYQLEMGSIEEGLIIQSLKYNRPIPGKIENAPELQEHLKIYFEAFLELDSERDFGFSAGPIKWSSIKEYGSFYKFDEEQMDCLFFFVRRMDNVRLRELRKKDE